jgi:hypothetical protein
MAKYRAGLLRALPGLAGAGSIVSRIHGDFHLGQVHVHRGRCEPLKAIDERRAKASPLVDVAGMLRSFRYAFAVATGERSFCIPEDVSRGPLASALQRAEAGTPRLPLKGGRNGFLIWFQPGRAIART